MDDTQLGGGEGLPGTVASALVQHVREMETHPGWVRDPSQGTNQEALF